MPPHPSATRRIAAGMLAACAVSLLGCSPAPQPEQTPTPAFASEEEAFAAAEATYRAYIDAGNARIAGARTPDPREFLTGLALEADIETVQLLSARGLHLEGEAALASFAGESTEGQSSPETVEALACVVVTGSRLIDSDGSDVTPADRPSTSSLHVTFIKVDGTLLISDSTMLEAPAC